MPRKISASFTAGVVAALLVALILRYLDRSGLFARIAVTLKPGIAFDHLLRECAWGGIWGLLSLLPLLKARTALRGLVIGLFPAAFTLFYRMPRQGHGLLGLNYGDWAPLVILASWLIWGMASAFWYKSAA